MILSPYGEGYCPVCRFIEPLGPDGKIEHHTRYVHGSRELCDGSGRRPPKRTPYAAGKSRFRVKGPKARCPHCRRKVAVASNHRYSYIGNHRGLLGGVCAGYGTEITV